MKLSGPMDTMIDEMFFFPSEEGDNIFVYG